MRRALLLALALAIAAPATAGAHGFASSIRGQGAFAGEQKVLVVPVTWGPESASVEDIRRVVFAETDAFMRASSYGKAWLVGDVVPWQQAFASQPSCDPRRIAAVAREAALQAGFEPGRYDRFVYMFPRIDCAWRGLGSGDQAWINGAPDRKLVAHELGHTYGLAHANSWECAATCRVVEYGDPYSTMGRGNGDFNVFEKTQLGWLTDVAHVERPGAYTLDRVELPASTPQALVVTSAATEYWFELRLEQLRVPFAGGFLPTGLLVRVAPNSAAPPQALVYPEPNLILPNPIGAGRHAVFAGETFGVRGAFDLRVEALLGDRAQLRFAWTDRTPPGRPRLEAPGARVARAGPHEVVWEEAVEGGSGVAFFEVRLVRRPPLRVEAGFAQSPVARFRKPVRGRHTISVVAVDRAGNRSRAAVRRFVVGR